MASSSSAVSRVSRDKKKQEKRVLPRDLVIKIFQFLDRRSLNVYFWGKRFTWHPRFVSEDVLYKNVYYVKYGEIGCVHCGLDMAFWAADPGNEFFYSSLKHRTCSRGCYNSIPLAIRQEDENLAADMAREWELEEHYQSGWYGDEY